ncbi:hypothetical protein PR048_032230 [Dryococelus australis]|uniref:ATP-dependent DNA helicase n=1 Tax=Dryococelus australis TaxID=614101 RepID=A0ABQ9G2U8_9NEOP|nr:hypothetical protein PR048_032230 [Dryococelus australis]
MIFFIAEMARGNKQLFGGALILLSGDFRQTPPVIPRSAPADELNVCLRSSVLWRHVQKLTSKTNMRVQVQHDVSVECFAEQLSDIGNRKIAIDESTHCITLPINFCKTTATTDELIHKVFPNIAQNYQSHQWLSERAILADKNNDANAINLNIQNEIPGEATTFKFIDTVMNLDEVVSYPTALLNSLHLSGMPPPHVLTLKISVPIYHSSPKYQPTTTLQRYQAFRERDDEQYHLSYNFKRKI